MSDRPPAHSNSCEKCQCQHGHREAADQETNHLGGWRQRPHHQFGRRVTMLDKQSVRRGCGAVEKGLGVGCRRNDRPCGHGQDDGCREAEALAPVSDAGCVEPFEAAAGQHRPPQACHDAPATRRREPTEARQGRQPCEAGQMPPDTQGQRTQQQTAPKSATAIGSRRDQSEHGHANRQQADVTERFRGRSFPGGPRGSQPQRVVVG